MHVVAGDNLMHHIVYFSIRVKKYHVYVKPRF